MELYPFEDILTEIDEKMSLVAFNGRIVSHIIHELLGDFFPNYCYNLNTQRFVRTSFQLTEDSGRNPLPKVLPMFLFGTKVIQSLFTDG